MQPLKNDFLDQCPNENGFRMRGVAMTRIEVFVDAAFAFAVTMLVISIDQIPKSVDELIQISKYIPSFILSVAQLAIIWYLHSIWCKKYGLEDLKTIILSISLVVAMLVFIYPLKMMYESMFGWISNQYFPSQFTITSYEDLRLFFKYFALAFMFVTCLFMLFYAHAYSLKDYLKLSTFELYDTQTTMMVCVSMILVCILAFFLPALVTDGKVPLTGFTYLLLIPLNVLIRKQRRKSLQIQQ